MTAAMDRPTSSSSPGGIGAVENAIAMLRCLSIADAPLGVSEIARRLGLHKSSISRLTQTLEKARLVAREPQSGRVRLGAGLVMLAARASADLHLKDVVRPALEELAAQAGETASFNLWDDGAAVTVEQAAGPGAVQIFAAPGRRDPGHCTACGKVLLAHQPEAAIEAYCAGPLQRFNERTITEPQALRRVLAAARKQGYALNRGEYDGDVGAASVLLRDARGEIAGSLTLTVPRYRFTTKRQAELVALLVAAAAKISRGLL